MSPPCTEVAFVTLTPDADPRDKDSKAGKILTQAFKTQSEQPGFQRQWWGLVEGNEHVLVACVDWDSIDDHERFMAADLYKPYMENFDQIIGGPVDLVRIPLKELAAGTTPSNKFSAPFTEIDIVYFPVSHASPEVQATFSRDAQDFARKFGQLEDPATRMAAGWALEASVERDGQGKGKEKAWVGVFGWNSKEQHNRAANSDVEKEYEYLWYGENRELWHGQVKLQQA